MNTLVLDTNIVLDVWVFADTATAPLRSALENQALRWIATSRMRTELARVLAYPQIAPRLAFYGRTAADILHHFDRYTTLQPDAPKCAFACKDADDQLFLDLAAAHRATLISKDKAVLCMAKRMHKLGVTISPVWRASDEPLHPAAPSP
jgi:putative PIN family toxin of toxin-antitoxin system